MSTVTITGKFNNSNNNVLSLEVFQLSPGGYSFQKKYHGSFKEVFRDLLPDNTYHVEFTGSTTGTVDIEIEGDIEANISERYESFFMGDFNLKTK